MVDLSLLSDMDKAITEMEIALSILKPELRDKDEMLAELLKHGRGGLKQRQHKLDKLEREMSSLGSGNRKGKGKEDKPRTARSLSSPSSLADFQSAQEAAIVAATQAKQVGRYLAPPSDASTPFSGLPGSAPAGAEQYSFPASGHSTAATSKSKTSSHKGLRGMFRKPSSQNSSTNSLGIPLGVSESGHHGRSKRSHSNASTKTIKPIAPVVIPPPLPSTNSHGFISPLPSAYQPPVSSPLRAPPTNSHNSNPGAPVIAALSSALLNLRLMHTTLTLQANEQSRTPAASKSTVTNDNGGGATIRDRRPSPTHPYEQDVDSSTSSAHRPPYGRSLGHERKMSSSSLISSVLSVWYDAELIPEGVEFEGPAHIDYQSDSDDDDSFLSEDNDTPPQSLSSQSTPTEDPSSFLPTHPPPIPPASEQEQEASLATNASSPSPSSDPVALAAAPVRPAAATSSSMAGSTPVPDVKWRTNLPAPTPDVEASLWGVLKKSMGKDLSTLSMPVTFNEPLSLLQRMAEEVEYPELLTLAANCLDPVERLCHIAAFAVAGYSGSKMRTTRKPFNPMLGETFEAVRPGLRFIAEKTSHHPPLMAAHADGEGWTMWGTSGAKQRIAMTSMEIQPLGSTFVLLNKTGEKFTWTKPSSYIRNLVAGKKYIETIGRMEVMNITTGDVCVLHFKEASWSGAGLNAVSGHVIDRSGHKVAWIDGKWDSKLTVHYGSPKDPPHVLWAARPWPPNAEQNYGWTYFTISLNQLDPSFSSLLPPTDSRFNPAQRALEEGDFDRAEACKAKQEAAQRARKAARDEAGETWNPRWFVEEAEGMWRYKGGYWETRETGEWEKLELW